MWKVELRLSSTLSNRDSIFVAFIFGALWKASIIHPWAGSVNMSTGHESNLEDFVIRYSMRNKNVAK